MKLLDYIKGNRKGKDAYRIERQAMDDPFLADALEGLDSVDGDHAKRIETLQKQLTKKLQPKTYHFKNWSIAASILICTSIGGYFIVQTVKNTDLFAVKEHVEESSTFENQEIAFTESPDSLSIFIPEKEIQRIKTEEIENSPMADMQMEKISAPMSTLSVASIESKKSEEISESAYKSQLQGMVSGLAVSSRVVRGKIVDQEGEPLVGVSVTQKGTQSGAVTGIDGTFALNTNSDNPLEARYLGFDSKEFRVDTSAPMLIAMNENTQRLDEVVVLGYGTERKSSMAGSVNKIKESIEIKPSPLMGMKAYQKYIKDNMKRPTDAVCGDKKGTVVLEFNIDSKGTPININVKKSICVSLDIEAIRLLQQGPKWTIGNQITELKVKF